MFDKDGRGHYEEMITIIKRFIDKDNSASNWIIDTHKLAPSFFFHLLHWQDMKNLTIFYRWSEQLSRGAIGAFSELIVDTDGRKERFQMFLCDLKWIN